MSTISLGENEPLRSNERAVQVEKLSTFQRLAPQVLLSLCVAMSFFYIGLIRGFSAPAVPSILENNPEIFPTKNIASWASSIPPCGACLGSILAAFSLRRIGRKYTIVLASPFATIGWILIATATRYELIIAGRFLTGFCAGLCLPAAQVYIGESCDPKIRGILGSFPTIFMSIAILSSYILGSLVKWDTLAWYSAFMTALFGVLLSFMPKSPVWLRSQRRYAEARLSLAWLNLPPQLGAAAEPAVENQDIKMTEIEKKNNEFTKDKLDFFTRPVLMPLGIGLTLLVLQQISGIDAIVFFTVEIFHASGSSVNHHLATIIVGLVQLISNILALFVVDKSGRKPLLIISAVVMSVSMAGMGFSFYCKQQNINSFGWLPLTSLVTYMIGFSIGFGCIPYLLLGELFPAQHRSVASAIAGSFNLGFMFIVIKTYHYLDALITTAGTFWMYSIFCALAVLFVIFVVPETKGRDLDDIAKLFIKNTKKSESMQKDSIDEHEKLNIVNEMGHV